MGIKAVIGDKLLKRKLRRTANRTPKYCNKAVRNVANHIHREAMDKLQSSLGTGYTGQKWGHSNQIPIAESKLITDTSDATKSEVKLEYISPHAWIVEFGGIGRVVSDDTPFPIGASQGYDPIFRQSFRLQQGKFYLTKTVKSPEVNSFFKGEVAKAIKRINRRIL